MPMPGLVVKALDSSRGSIKAHEQENLRGKSKISHYIAPSQDLKPILKPIITAMDKPDENTLKIKSPAYSRKRKGSTSIHQNVPKLELSHTPQVPVRKRASRVAHQMTSQLGDKNAIQTDDNGEDSQPKLKYKLNPPKLKRKVIKLKTKKERAFYKILYN